MQQPGRDPRDIITPDAFRVADHLIGTPLASPWRRAAAILIDLAVVGVLALLIEAPGLIFATIGAYLVWRFSRGTSDRWWKRLFRRAFGCFGSLLVFGVLLGLWIAVFDGDDGDDDPAAVTADGTVDGAVTAGGGWAGLFTSLSAVRDYNRLRTTDNDSARAASARRLVRLLAGQPDVGAAELSAFARDAAASAERGEPLLPPEGWSALARAAEEQARLLAAGDSLPRDSLRLADAGGSPIDLDTTGDSPPAATDGLAAAGDSAGAPADTALVAARDTIAGLEQRVAELRDELADQRNDADVLRAALEESDRGPIRAMMSGLADDFGIGFGWLALYFTAFLVIGGGQTPGKRLVRIRVLRLDAQPIGWWVALQRFGGYSASIFTGLLGFFEIFWDDNRQGLQDKLVHTVVIDERAQRRQAAGLGPAPASYAAPGTTATEAAAGTSGAAGTASGVEQERGADRAPDGGAPAAGQPPAGGGEPPADATGQEEGARGP